MKNKTRIVSLFLFLSCTLPLIAQPVALFDALLGSDAINAQNAAWLIESALAPQQELEPRAALAKLLARPGLEVYAGVNPNALVTRAEFAFLVQLAFQVPRGLFASLFPGPRYALRDLRYLGLISELGNPEDALSGAQALDIVNRALENGYRGSTE